MSKDTFDELDNDLASLSGAENLDDYEEVIIETNLDLPKTDEEVCESLSKFCNANLTFILVPEDGKLVSKEIGEATSSEVMKWATSVLPVYKEVSPDYLKTREDKNYMFKCVVDFFLVLRQMFKNKI